MSGRILDGRPIAAEHKADLIARVAALAETGDAPGLAIARFADDGPEMALRRRASPGRRARWASIPATCAWPTA